VATFKILLHKNAPLNPESYFHGLGIRSTYAFLTREKQQLMHTKCHKAGILAPTPRPCSKCIVRVKSNQTVILLYNLIKKLLDLYFQL